MKFEINGIDSANVNKRRNFLIIEGFKGEIMDFDGLRDEGFELYENLVKDCKNEKGEKFYERNSNFN